MDGSMFQSQQVEVRMLYTVKSFSCKACKRRDEGLKLHKKRNKGKAKGTPKPLHVTDAPCPHCNDTGVLPYRVYDFLGVWEWSHPDACVRQVTLPRAYTEDDPSGIYHRITLCSVYHTLHDYTPVYTTPPASPPLTQPLHNPSVPLPRLPPPHVSHCPRATSRADIRVDDQRHCRTAIR